MMGSAQSALAAIASAIVPGAGQMLSGQIRRGFALLVGLPVQAGLIYGVAVAEGRKSGGSAFEAATGGSLVAMIACLFVLWAWNVWDAWRSARGTAGSLTLPVLTVLVLNLLAALLVTEVRAPSLQAEQRGVIGRIMLGLASPDVLEPRSNLLEATARYVIRGPVSAPPPSPLEVGPEEPEITVTPTEVTQHQLVRVKGRRFAPNARGRLVLLSTDELPLGSFTTDVQGRFEASFRNPRSTPGRYFVQARMRVPTGGWTVSNTLATAAPLMLQTVYLALLGTALSLLFALPLSFLGARNLMSASPLLKAVYGITRGAFTVLRSVEVLIIAVIAVAALGIGPFAGVIALAIHGIGAMGKLYSEAIESIEHGPIEAIRATGANEMQVVMYAVVPQVVPQFIAFTLYRWDINVRMATVIGLVGGGGIGYLLVQYMNLLQWRQAATAIWLIAGVVMLMDYASAVIREKVV